MNPSDSPYESLDDSDSTPPPNSDRKKLSPNAKMKRYEFLTRLCELSFKRKEEQEREKEKKKKKKKRYRKRCKKQDKLNPPTWKDIYAKAEKTVLARRITMLAHS